MRGRYFSALSAVTLATALAGCGQKPAPVPPAGALPSSREGLWLVSTMRDGRPAGLVGEVRACLDGDGRSRLGTLWGHAGKSMCEQRAETRDGDGVWHFASTCDLGPLGRVATQGELTGDLASRYRVYLRTDTTGAMSESMNGHHVVELEGHYLGACPAGLKTGDVMLGNGMKVNMNHLRNVAATLGGG